MKIKIAILASGRGSNFKSLLDNSKRDDSFFEITVLLSDKEQSGALMTAKKENIPNFHINPKNFKDKKNFEEEMVKIIKDFKCDLVCLAGYMKILSPAFLKSWGKDVINIHPSLLPSFPGLDAQKQAIDYGVKISGCTLHFVDEGMDTGKIIAQRAVPVLETDNEESLSARILEEEHKLYTEAVNLYAKKKSLKRRGIKMKRALLSVSDKTNLVGFAKELVDLGYEIVSTGGTKKHLSDNQIPVTGVDEVTGCSEILGGRVKTLHPNIHGGLLAKDTDDHMKVLADNNIMPIDLVCVNLYPFVETILKKDITLEDAVENIDIGGPTMVRASAKNHERVTVIVKPERYTQIITELKNNGEVSLKTRRLLALEAFTHTAEYDTAISNYLNKEFSKDIFPETINFTGIKVQDLRYGENPHQKAAFYKFPFQTEGTVAGGKQIQGKELSYNNIVDIEAAWNIAKDFKEEFAAIVIKHTNPCGSAVAETQLKAYLKAYEGDPVSAFGGIVGLNKKVEKETAEEICKIFVEAVVAPEFSEEALEIFAQKENIRIIEMGYAEANKELWIEKVGGGFLLQESDSEEVDLDLFEVVTEAKPNEEDLAQLLFAWKIAKSVKSNAIVLAKDFRTIGVGAGQMNRVGSAKIAYEQAGELCKGSFLASDAFFPFRDTVDSAGAVGIKAIIQPGGSIRDKESIDACNEQGIIMIFTKRRHFKH